MNKQLSKTRNDINNFIRYIGALESVLCADGIRSARPAWVDTIAKDPLYSRVPTKTLGTRERPLRTHKN